MKRDSSVKGLVSTATLKIALVHGLLTTPNDATDVPESGAGQRTDGEHEDHDHAIDFTQVLKKAVDYECLRY